MEQDKLWATFQKSGSVHDYLRYCGIDVYGAGENAVSDNDTGEKSHETDHRRTDNTGKQYGR